MKCNSQPTTSHRYTVYPRYRAGAACGLAELELVTLRGGRRLTIPEWEQLEECYLVYRCAISKLGAYSVSCGVPRWRQRPKTHSLEHAVYDFNRANLRYMANYLDEDFVRRSKQLAVKSTPKFVSRHVLFRYAIAVCLRWTGMSP